MNYGRNIYPVPAPGLEAVGEHRSVNDTVPIGCRQIGFRYAQLCNPVDARAALAAHGFRYGIADEFLILMAGHEHGLAVQIGIGIGNGAPQHAARKTQFIRLRMKEMPYSRMNADK